MNESSSSVLMIAESRSRCEAVLSGRMNGLARANRKISSRGDGVTSRYSCRRMKYALSGRESVKPGGTAGFVLSLQLARGSFFMLKSLALKLKKIKRSKTK